MTAIDPQQPARHVAIGGRQKALPTIFYFLLSIFYPQ